MTHIPDDAGPATGHDPVDSAIGALASSRWTREPDWSLLKEKLVKIPKVRFGLARRRPVLFATIAAASLCAAAAAAVKIYDEVYFSFEIALDDGGVAQVDGVVVTNGPQTEITVNASAPDGSTGSGESVVTLPDGSVVHVITGSGGAAAKAK